MGTKTGTVRSEAEIARLMQQLSQLPKATTAATPQPSKSSSTKWRHKSTTIATSNRVNKTKGK